MSTTTFRRGMWVWNGYDVASNPSAFLTECKRIKITDVYLYLTISNYSKVNILGSFIKSCSSGGMRVWGLDGSRAYFTDASGPANLYNSIKALISYNGKVSSGEKFFGFQTDNEPDNYSGQYLDTIHNDIPTSILSKTAGGVYKQSAYADRVFILQDWINIQKQCTSMLHSLNLASGAALPSWLDDYYDEPLTVTFDGITQTVMKHMMNYVDDYCIMSYQTDTSIVAQRVVSELTYGSTIPGKRVFPGVETVTGRGAAVTYGDNYTKAKKSAVLSDIAKMEGMFSKFASFAGINIHDWIGWSELPA